MLAVAAIPAAFVIYLLVMAFLGSFENMSTGLQAIVAMTLLCCVVVLLLPVYALVAGPKAAKADKQAAAQAESVAATEEADLEEDALVEESDEEFVAAETQEEEDLFAAGDDEEFDYFDEEPSKK